MPHNPHFRRLLEDQELWQALQGWFLERLLQASQEMEAQVSKPEALEWRGRKRLAEEFLRLQDEIREESELPEDSTPPPTIYDDGL